MWLSKKYEIHANSKLVEEALYVVADTIGIHPVRAWLRSLRWDRKHRLDSVFIRLAGAPDTAYTREVTKNFLIGAIARIVRPGCQLDSLPIFEGIQGAGKTSFFKALFGDQWFLSTNIEITTKDAYQVLQRKWCVELGELESLSRTEITRVKQYVSQSVDTYRPSYARRAQDFPRQSVFVGTTNDDQYLKDGTGARRFWPIEVKGVLLPNGSIGINIPALALEREQLFAEAYHRFKKGELWHIADESLKKEAAVVAEGKRQRDPWEVPIGMWAHQQLKVPGGRFRINRGLSTHDVLTSVFNKDPSSLSRTDEMRAAAALRALGYTDVKQRTIGGVVTRVYRKPKMLEIAELAQDPEGCEKSELKPRGSQPSQPKLGSKISKKI